MLIPAPRYRGCAIAGVLLGGVGLLTAAGLDTRVDLGVISGQGWRADGVSIDLRLETGDGLGGVFRADLLTLDGWERPVRDLEIQCPRGTWSGGGLRCEAFDARFTVAGLGLVRGRGAIAWTRAGGLHLRLEEGEAAGGRFRLELRRPPGRAWRMHFRARSLQAARLAGLLPGMAGSLQGRLDLQGRLALDDAGGLQAEGTLEGQGLAYTEPTGLREAQGVGLHAELQVRREAHGWRGGGRVRLDAGQLYWDPWYLEPSPQGVELAADARGTPETGVWVVEGFRFHDPGALLLEGGFTVQAGSPPRVTRLRLGRLELVLPRAYETYLRPPLIGTVLDEVETSGRLEGRLELAGGTVSELELTARRFDAVDGQGRFGLWGVDGTLEWGGDGKSAGSRVHLDRLAFYRLATGPFELHLRSRGRGLELAAPARIPVFDGRLEIDRFSMEDLFDPLAGWSFDAVLTPVSMPSLTRALEWPEMDGTLSGVIPEVVYADGTLRVGGALLVRVFDGAVVVDGLTLEDPFGVVPVLRADVQVRDLDLALLTRHFHFGHITGRLGGYVRDLVLESWSPVRFDAWLGTPEGDRSRHRISQRAVENLSSLGGGPAAALSTGFLRVFEEFSYDRLGLGCRLENGVCTMRGVEPAEGGGYYIVQGAGLPRIDVIGYRRRVDWDRLVERLSNLAGESAPVVE